MPSWRDGTLRRSEVGYGSAAGITVDSEEFAKLREAFGRLPAEMQKKVMARAFGRSRSVVERNYSQLASARIDVAQKHIKRRMRSWIGSGDLTLAVKSTQIPLRDLNPKQQVRGVGVPLRGSYRSAFLAKAKSGKQLVLKRPGAPSTKAARYPIKELFGPNPAGEATRNPATYEEMLGEIANGVFFAEMARGVSYMLGRLG
ncbi:hypothetical protein [Aurantimonas coralicida]|uniref:hypothetical protein n=1 Tax=Aurantimonas coralicida TaxID=182270 RepID=UPI001D18F1BD|nr:hypothetical protein [Aurantimonas coralicida]MCC4299327.1 hypothetical protein [Aurantimonas coralicida]